MPATAPTNSELAAKYQCASRTITRLRKAGVEVSDPVAVATALAGQKHVSRRMLEAALIQLTTANP